MNVFAVRGGSHARRCLTSVVTLYDLFLLRLQLGTCIRGFVARIHACPRSYWPVLSGRGLTRALRVHSERGHTIVPWHAFCRSSPHRQDRERDARMANKHFMETRYRACSDRIRDSSHSARSHFIGNRLPSQ